MSTIKVTNIDPPSAGGAVNVNGVAMPNAGPLSSRNFIINGAMQVAQRNTQVTGVTTSGYRTCDRFTLAMSALGTWTVDQDTNAPDGFSNSFKLTCTTADASPAASNFVMFRHTIEAQNLQSLAFGTTAAQSITLSFWVRSNKTGNASLVAIQNDNSNKMTSFQYSISSADTWEHKTITIPGDTAGVINNDNGEGMLFEWWLNSGSTYTGGSHQATWSTLTNANRNVSNFGLGGATSDYWQITGVQLELGDQATPFEHRSYGDELQRCYRYYQVVGDGTSGGICSAAAYNGSTAYGVIKISPMRAAPTLDEVVATDAYTFYENSTSNNFSGFSSISATDRNVRIQKGSLSLTAGDAGWFEIVGANGYIALDAEL